jgi:hypothetical protein
VTPAARAEEQLHRLGAVVRVEQLAAEQPPQRLGRARLAGLLLQGANLLGAVKLSVG